jgi:hypothetical protein
MRDEHMIRDEMWVELNRRRNSPKPWLKKGNKKIIFDSIPGRIEG